MCSFCPAKVCVDIVHTYVCFMGLPVAREERRSEYSSFTVALDPFSGMARQTRFASMPACTTTPAGIAAGVCIATRILGPDGVVCAQGIAPVTVLAGATP
ncbi:hypothetical protein QFZ30_002085 [Arthrobacter pascens]|nr:hypothetical protein [Arthrobacter pascens]